MKKEELMEDSVFKRIRVVDVDGDVLVGKNMGYQTAYDNDGEASVCIMTDDGCGVCLMESEIDTIEMLSFKLYESVRIKSSGITGVVVAEDTDGGTEPPIYFVEKDDEYKTGKLDNDCVWCRPEEIEYV